MKTKTILLSLFLAFFAISCNHATRSRAETANNEIAVEQNNNTQKEEYIVVYRLEEESTYCCLLENDSEIIQFPLNELYSIRIKKISQDEFTTRRRESRHLQHRPNYQVIRDNAEVRKLLGDRVRAVGEKMGGMEYGFERIDGSWDYGFWYNGIDITYSNGVTKAHNISWNWNLISYYPELGILSVSCFFILRDFPLLIYLNNSEKSWQQIGHPNFHNLSPDRQWRLNGSYGKFGFNFYFLEKWNPARRRFEFAGNLYDIPDISFASDCFWVGNSTLLLQSLQGRFEIEIIANERK